jgi:hypothetical protein
MMAAWAGDFDNGFAIRPLIWREHFGWRSRLLLKILWVQHFLFQIAPGTAGFVRYGQQLSV